MIGIALIVADSSQYPVFLPKGLTMQLLKNFLFTELKAVLFFFFMPFGVILGVFMALWHVLDMPPRSEDHEEYVSRVKWDLNFIAVSICKPFETLLNGICEFIADAFIIPRQASTTRRKL